MSILGTVTRQRALQRADLSRQRRLAEVQAADRPPDPAGIHDGDEGAKVAQLHLMRSAHGF